jgi:ADP-heptose:LPS heptosyltransferase
MSKRQPVVEFDSTPFEFSHGRCPKGRGSWAFSVERNPDVTSPAVLFSPSMTYGEAKRFAREHFRKLASHESHITLYVLS